MFSLLQDSSNSGYLSYLIFDCICTINIREHNEPWRCKTKEASIWKVSD